MNIASTIFLLMSIVNNGEKSAAGMERNMNQEVLFASTLEKIRKQAKEQGNCIEENQVRKAFEPLHLEESQMQMVFDYLVKHKVGIGTPVNPDEYLSEEERDYLQDYLKELEALKEYSEGEKQAYTLAAMAGEADACGNPDPDIFKGCCGFGKVVHGTGCFSGGFNR